MNKLDWREGTSISLALKTNRKPIQKDLGTPPTTAQLWRGAGCWANRPEGSQFSSLVKLWHHRDTALLAHLRHTPTRPPRGGGGAPAWPHFASLMSLRVTTFWPTTQGCPKGRVLYSAPAPSSSRADVFLFPPGRGSPADLKRVLAADVV